MATFWQDLRHSLRMLLKRSGFTLTVVITLALGMGANATIFTWIKAVLLDPLPGIERPDQLVEIWGATRHNSALSTHELGIRISIGAGRGDVLKLILGQALMLAAIGMTGGLVTALAVTRFAANLLYGISPADLLTFASIAIMLFAVALVAGYLPARRATRIDPMIALRSE